MLPDLWLVKDQAFSAVKALVVTWLSADERKVTRRIIRVSLLSVSVSVPFHEEFLATNVASHWTLVPFKSLAGQWLLGAHRQIMKQFFNHVLKPLFVNGEGDSIVFFI